MNFRKLLKSKSATGIGFQIVLGFWLAAFSFQATNAQWAVTIVADSSPTTIAQVQQATQQSATQLAILADNKESHIQQYIKYAKEAAEWIETVEHYTTMVTQNIKRFTSLRGILSVVEKNLGLSDDTLKALSDIGQAIRATLSLKNQFINMVRSQLSMIGDLEQRARSGIFDPQADLADLEEYLTKTMGREARVTLLTRQRLAQVNPELTKLTEEWQKIRAKRAAAEKEKTELEEKLRTETSLSSNTRDVTVGEDGSATTQTGRVSTSSDAVSSMVTRIGQLELLINDLEKQERELTEKIQKIYEKAHARFDNVYFTGEKWKDNMDGWSELQEAKNNAITGLIDSYGTR